MNKPGHLIAALTRQALRHGGGLFVVLALALPAPLSAQDSDAEEGYRILESLPPPDSAQAQDYLAASRMQRRGPEVTYVTRLEGQLSSGRDETPPEAPVLRPTSSGNTGTLIAVVALLVLLGLFLKFGGGGALLARPAVERTRPQGAGDTPDAWRASTREGLDNPGGLLARLAAMEDRAAALVILLRHCLLAAAETTQTRLARGDTERSAFERLPDSWRPRGDLAGLLHQTELAHYGGRAVDDTGFAAALETGRALLGAPDRGARHG